MIWKKLVSTLRIILVISKVSAWTAGWRILSASGRLSLSATVFFISSLWDSSLRFWTVSRRVWNRLPTTLLWSVAQAEALYRHAIRIRVRWTRCHVAVKQILLSISYSATNSELDRLINMTDIEKPNTNSNSKSNQSLNNSNSTWRQDIFGNVYSHKCYQYDGAHTRLSATHAT